MMMTVMNGILCGGSIGIGHVLLPFYLLANELLYPWSTLLDDNTLPDMIKLSHDCD